jgi:predicted  nucleic acid-binding Zn ribbon protein
MFLLVVLLLFTTSCDGASGNPLLGVWKLDLGQSDCGSDLEFLKDSWLLGKPNIQILGQVLPSYAMLSDASEYIIIEGNRVLVKVDMQGTVITFLFRYAVSGSKLTLENQSKCTYTRR